MGAVVNLWDGLRNVLLGVGTGRDASAADSYSARTLTQHEIDQAYRGSGILRKVIAIPALDAVREWRDWKGLDADQSAAVFDEERRLGIRQKVVQAEILRGLGGGALILGLPGDLVQPVPATVGKQTLAFVHVVSRWHMSFERLEDDARLEGFGEPRMWRMQSGGRQVEVHPSRVIPFRADTASSLAAVSIGDQSDVFWGESRVAQVMRAAQDYDKAYASFAAMLHKARLSRVAIPNLSGQMAIPGGKELLQQRVSDIALGESMFNYTIFDGGEDGKSAEVITDVEYSWTGAKDMLDSFGTRLCAVADIPATRLLGTSAPGLNSSGNGEQTDWRKKIGAMQTLDIAPCLDRLDRYLLPSAIGSTPPDASYSFAPLDNPSDKENADRFKVQMEAATALQATGAIPEQAFNRGLQSLMIEEGYLPELEMALAELPDDERYGIVAELDPADDPALQKGGDPNLAGEGGDPNQAPPRRAANDGKPAPEGA